MRYENVHKTQTAQQFDSKTQNNKNRKRSKYRFGTISNIKFLGGGGGGLNRFSGA